MTCNISYSDDGMIAYCTPPLMGFQGGGSIVDNRTRRVRKRRSKANPMSEQELKIAKDARKENAQ